MHIRGFLVTIKDTRHAPVCIVKPSCGSCPVCELQVTRNAGNKIQDNGNSCMKRDI